MLCAEVLCAETVRDPFQPIFSVTRLSKFPDAIHCMCPFQNKLPRKVGTGRSRYHLPLYRNIFLYAL